MQLPANPDYKRRITNRSVSISQVDTLNSTNLITDATISVAKLITKERTLSDTFYKR